MLTWCYRDLDVSVIYCKFPGSCPCDVPFLAVSLFSCEKSTVTIVTFPTSRKNGGFGNPPACWGLFFLTCLQPFESTKGRCEQDKRNGMLLKILKDSNSLSQIESARTKTQSITTGIPDFTTAFSTSWRKDVRLLFFAGNHFFTTSACASRNTKFRAKPCKPRHWKKEWEVGLV